MISGLAGTDGLIFNFFLLELELELDELFFLPIIAGSFTSGLLTTGGLISGFDGTDGFKLIFFFDELLELELDELFFLLVIEGGFISGLLITGGLTSALISGFAGTEGLRFTFFLDELLELELDELFFLPAITGGLTSGLLTTGALISGLFTTGGWTFGLAGTGVLILIFFLLELELELEELFFFAEMAGGLTSGLLIAGGLTSTLTSGLITGTEGLRLIFFFEELLELELDELFFFPEIAGGFTSGLLTTGGLTAGTEGLIFNFFLLELLELELEEDFFLATIEGGLTSGLLITGGLISGLLGAEG